MPILEDPGPLQVERLADGRRRLLRALHYKVDGEDDLIKVPKGFVTDFSSDPIGLPGLVEGGRGRGGSRLPVPESRASRISLAGRCDLVQDR